MESSESSKVFGERVNELLSVYGKSKKDLIFAIDSNYTSLWQWSNGVKFPHVETMIKIADFFGVSLDFLAGRTEIQEVQKDDK